MLGRVDFWDKEGGVGTVTDVEGKEWHVSDDMINADEVKSKMKNGFILNFEPNPALDNSGMHLTMASPDDKARYDKERSAKKSPLADNKMSESAKSDWDKAEEVRDEIQFKLKKERAKAEPDRAKIKELVKKLADARKKAAAAYKKYKAEDINMMQSALFEADEEGSIDREKIKAEAPYDLKEYVDTIISNVTKPFSIEDLKDACDDTDALSEAADADIDVYTQKLLAWYAEDANRLAYATEGLKDGIADTKDAEKILQTGQYLYHSEYYQKAAEWLKEYLEDQEAAAAKTEEGAEIGGLISR